ncbi:MAG TPA: glycosyltransferase family 39 protein [Solirubrobacteraceae bacterium]|nr:glycosyltransferase family 39 protein [Solirubrobacteraceae bacterium]
MSTSQTAPPRLPVTVEPPPQRPPAGHLRRWALLLPVGVFVVTVGLRLFHLRTSYDVFLDESIYSRISAGAATDGRLVFGNYPFYLHGPLSFYLQAFVIRVFGIGGTAIDVIERLRVFNVLVAGGVAVLVYAIVRTITRPRWGLLGAALFACDPFIVSFDSRLFIETLATFWVLLGFYLLLPMAVEPVTASGTSVPPKRYGRAVAGGFAFGLALLTKETSAPLYVLPLLVCIVRGGPLRRGTAATSLGTALVTYSPYPVIAVLTGGGYQFSYQKFGGIERMLGIIQATGYNRPGVPSLLSRVTANLGTFGMTYVLIALGGCAGVWLYRNGSARQRWIAMWVFGAFLELAFQIAQGTIEEQMFYYLVVPSIVAVASTAPLLLARFGTKPLRVLAVAVVVAIAGFDLITWVGSHTGRDTAMANAVGWMQSHAPADSRVAPLADGIQFLLPDYRLEFNPEAGEVSPSMLQASHSQFVVTSSLQAEQGYSAASPALLAWLGTHARRRFASTGATAGTVVVWELPGALPDELPPGPEPLVPRAPISVGAPTYKD